MLLHVEDCEIDTDAFELRRAGRLVPTEPLVFDLIRFLAENHGRLLSRDEVIDGVWNGRFVSDATVSGCIKAARQALGDNGKEQRFIRTVRGRGFQFVPEVRSGTPRVAATTTNPTASHPSLVVLPFEVFGDADVLPVLSDGLVENLTTVLVRVPLLALASRSSSFAYKGKSPTPAIVQADLGANYMLEGSLQGVSDKVRANVQLIETAGGFHLWAQQFDVPDGAGALDALLKAILPRLEAQLVRAMFNDLGANDGEMNARQLLLKATGLLSLKGWHRDTFVEATALLRQSVTKEPGLALAHAYLAIILGLGHRVGLLEKSESVAREAIANADRALELDNMDSISVGLAGCALADVGQTERAIPLLKRAIDLNPNNGHAWAALGSAQLILGKSSDAVDNLKHSVAISPMDARLSVWLAILALAHLQTGDLEAAKRVAVEGCQFDDRAYMPRVALAAVWLAADDSERMATAMKDCIRVKPDIRPTEIASLVGHKVGNLLWEAAVAAR